MCKLTRLNYNPISLLVVRCVRKRNILYSNVSLPLTHTHIPPHPPTGFSDGTFRGAISEFRKTGGECQELRMAIRVLDGKNC